jgi:hypothetical protein
MRPASFLVLGCLKNERTKYAPTVVEIEECNFEITIYTSANNNHSFVCGLAEHWSYCLHEISSKSGV